MPISSARAESMHIVQGKFFELPEIGKVTTNEEKIAALEAIKPVHYAKLAQTIHVLLEDIGGIKSKSKKRVPKTWEGLRSRFLMDVYESTKRVSKTEVFLETSLINDFIGSVDAKRHIDPYQQLLSGADTAASAMLTDLRNINNIAEYYDQPVDPLSLEETARVSISLPTRPAMTCVNRMLAAQTVLGGQQQYQSWSNIDQVLDPEQYEIREHETTANEICYKDFNNMEIPAGYIKPYTNEVLGQSTRVGEIACYQTITIGCPITLIKADMSDLWFSFIDQVSYSNLWHD